MQDGEQAGVGLRVLQLPVDQLEHLGSTLGVDVDLGECREQWLGWGKGAEKENRGEKTLPLPTEQWPTSQRAYLPLPLPQALKRRSEMC